MGSPASLVIVGEISHTLRAQGNSCGTGVIGTGLDSPVVSGKYEEIPQFQIGLLDYATFANLTSDFIDNGTDRNPWNLVGANSLDAIFAPYNNLSDSSRAGPYMAYWTDPEDTGSVGNSVTLNPYDPFGRLQIVDSQVPKTGLSIDDDVWFSGGHNISMALSYNPLDAGSDGSGGYVGATGICPSGSGSPVDFYFEKDHWARHTVERKGIRGVGLRSPMVLTGWGYDIDDNPVPADIGNPTTFHPEASWNPHHWKSGPVDLRWDNERGVWTGGNTTKLYLVKLTNLYTPPSFSFEVDRSNSRDQYARNAPDAIRTFDSTGNLYDPEYVAYTNNSAANVGYYEQLDYDDVEYPYYEAFIVRETKQSPINGNSFYNIWTQDCNDCGHITVPCGGGHDTSSVKKKILIENPLRQAFDVGDLAFTVYTGRKQRVNTGSFTGGTGSGASATISTDSSGLATFTVNNGGSEYSLGGFAVLGNGCKICSNITLLFEEGSLTGATLEPSGGFSPSQSCAVTIYPYDAQAETESLPVHWVIQSEFKSQQVVTHVECDNGILQTCTMKLQTQGFKTCEWCGEDTALINN
jgi:hypothetical protein